MRLLGVALSVVCLLSIGCSSNTPKPGSGTNEGTDAGSGGNAQVDAGGHVHADAGGTITVPSCKVGATRQCGTTKTETGACSFGKQTCGDSGSWGKCVGAVEPTDETCDGVDNDCDGATDEELLTTFYRDMDGDGAGGTEEQDACKDPDGSKGEWVAAGGDCDDNNKLVAPGKAEVCDGIDNDCNGDIDDGLDLKPELCDGLDNDCNGDIDDGLAAVPAANVNGPCSANLRDCVAGSYQDRVNNYAPTAEACDGVDNDCSGAIDDGLPSIPVANVQGACANNVQVCGGIQGYVNSPSNYVPTVEVCDGIDNDCANGVDDGLGEIASTNTQGACANNKKFCYGANGYVDKPDNYQPVAEICDGIDNDCANGVDNGMGPIATANTQGACSGNLKVCNGASGYQDKASNYVPVVEICDGVDNDCANGVDDGLAAIPATNVQGACSANTRFCKGVGGYVNSPSNYVPVAEICDGIDNDCTGGVDNGLGPIPATNVQGACVSNKRVCLGVSGYVNSPANYAPVAEICDGLDNDCANGIDDGLPELPDTNLAGACANNKKVCQGVSGYVGKITNYQPTATDTSCDGVDQDCSGTADEDYVPKTNCFLPGVCTPGNVASSCTPFMEVPCKNTPPSTATDQCTGLDDNCNGVVECGYVKTALTDTTCDGKDDDCDNNIDDDFVVDTSCFKPGVCAAGNQASSCNVGKVTACKTGAPTSATDTTCDGKDDDCSGAADEDFVADKSCFKSGVCAVGNVQSKCTAGVLTACKTNAPTTTEDLCAGKDDNCDGTVDTVCYNQLTNNQPSTCGGCYKDLFAGRYVYCDGTYAKATKTGCAWDGSNCTFAPNTNVTAAQCQALCTAEPGCYFATDYYDSICNLHLMTQCVQGSSGASGNIYQKQVSCLPTALTDTTCDGVDDDCDGTVDDDWVPDSSCFKQGLCAPGNVASKCTNHVLTACKTGTAAPQDLCNGQDDNCDGTVASVCFTQLTSNTQQTCKGCYKDMFAGQYVYCDGTYPEATKTGCDWVGGSGACTFPANKNVTAAQCQTLCENEPGCYFFTSYSNSICNLHLMRSCSLQSTGSTGSVFKKNVACIPLSQTDATCDGVDDDCSGTADEDWVADSSCFKPGVCAAGNQTSKCTNGNLTACTTGAATSVLDQCAGKDDNCDGTTDTSCWTEITNNTTSTCAGCYKDLYAGQYVYCDGTYAGAAKSNCSWVGGPGNCTFPRQTSVTAAQCRALCDAEPGCSYITSYYDSICNLHLMTSCTQQTSSATGSIFASPNACVPKYADDSSCDGKDDDCDGKIDEDYVADTSCFKPGACAVGNVASKCVAGVATACKTGNPASASDMCMGKDDNCDGTVDTVCFTQLTTNTTQTCSGCRKDMAAGAYINCNGGVAGATKTNCPSASGGSGCTFTANASLTQQQCLDLCTHETGCYFATSSGGSCNLHLMSSCTQVTTNTAGNIFRVDGCIPSAATDITCDGKDDDCSGKADEDYVPNTSCYKPGTCAAGDVPSSCSLGVESLCKTGTPAAADACGTNTDDNCDGTVTKCIDTDGDGIPDATDVCDGDNTTGDTDHDTVCNDLDNCPSNANASQADADRDGFGDACDNCPNKASSDQNDADADHIGDVCDPDFVPPSTAPKGTTDSRGCGFVPHCPTNSPTIDLQAYRFGCYDDNCLGDRWWYHLQRRIYPGMVGDQSDQAFRAIPTVEGILDELEKPMYNAYSSSCTNTSQCPSGASCLSGVCIYPIMKNFIDRLSNSSDFLSCTGTNSFENTWPAARVTKLDSGPCGWGSLGWKSEYGYRIVNTLSQPMTVWIGRTPDGTGDANKRWWTINPGEEIRFNSYDVAYVFPTTSAAYNSCSPSFMVKTDYLSNLTPPSFTQINPMPLVKYEVAGDGALIVYRDKYLKTDFDLFAYPNYFEVGLGPKGTNGNKPLYGFQATGYPPSVGTRYPELNCF